MARIRYLVDKNPSLSMRLAVESENIVFARFYNQFIELWGRLSTGNFSDTFSTEDAIRTKDGVPVYGKDRVNLFKDGAVGWKYTKAFCELIGADYDYLHDHRYDVDDFYVMLNGNVVPDLTDAANVTSTMENLESELNALGIDRAVLTWVIDGELDVGAAAGLTLSELRNISSTHVDFNTGLFASEAELYGLKPVLECYGLPTAISPSGDPVTVPDHLRQIFILFLQFTDVLDAVFNTVSVADTTLPDRDGYHQYEYVVTFSFDSTDTTSLIDWSPLTSLAFVNDFAEEYAAAKTWAEENLVCNDLCVKCATNYCYYEDTPQKNVIVYTSLSTFLNAYSASGELFYSPVSPVLTYWLKSVEAYIRYEKLGDMRTRDIVLVLMLSLKIGADEKDGGWLGGSWFGKVLEMIFVAAVIVIAVLASILLDNPYPLIAGMALLYGAARFTNMSTSGKHMAGVGIRVLSVAMLAYGIYDIYNQAYNLAVEDAAAAATEEGLVEGTVSELGMITSSVGVIDVISSAGLVNLINVMSKLYGAFNLLAAHDGADGGYAEVESGSDVDSGIYSVQSSYDFYDTVYETY